MSAVGEKEEVVEEEDEEEDLEKLEAEILRMEEEAARINKETEEMEKKSDTGATDSKESGTAKLSGEAKTAQDARSIYVGQVDYSATPEELVKHFEACGTVERVTIMCDKFTGQPKGFAYLEFQNEEAVENAVKLDGSDFKERQLKVTRKRVNQPGMAPRGRGRGGGRGGGRGPPGRGFRGGRGGGRGRGGFRGGGRGGYRGGGRGGGGGYHPYY